MAVSGIPAAPRYQAPTADALDYHSGDRETRVNTQGEVQHAVSARNNLLRVPLDILDAVNPINNIVAAVSLYNERASQGDPIQRLMSLIEAPLGITWAFFCEIFEILLLPFFLVKDLGDAVVHGAAALTNGRDEGEEAPMPRGMAPSIFSPTIDLPGVKAEREAANMNRARATAHVSLPPKT